MHRQVDWRVRGSWVRMMGVVELRRGGGMGVRKVIEWARKWVGRWMLRVVWGVGG